MPNNIQNILHKDWIYMRMQLRGWLAGIPVLTAVMLGVDAWLEMGTMSAIFTSVISITTVFTVVGHCVSFDRAGVMPIRHRLPVSRRDYAASRYLLALACTFGFCIPNYLVVRLILAALGLVFSPQQMALLASLSTTMLFIPAAVLVGAALVLPLLLLSSDTFYEKINRFYMAICVAAGSAVSSTFTSSSFSVTNVPQSVGIYAFGILALLLSWFYTRAKSPG